jgi:hypothetical protein
MLGVVCVACQKPFPPGVEPPTTAASVVVDLDGAGHSVGSGRTHIETNLPPTDWRIIEIIDRNIGLVIRCWFCPDHFPNAADAPVEQFVEAFARCIVQAVEQYEMMRRRASKAASN